MHKVSQHYFYFMITFDECFSFENLLESARQCLKGVRWKLSTQCFEIELLERVAVLKRELDEGTYKSMGFRSFDIWERGKKRHIQAVHISERVVQKCLCDNCLKPILQPCLISTNSASQAGKGTDYALKHLTEDLRWHYVRYGTEGGILIGDFHDFFGSISHKILESMLTEKIADRKLLGLTIYFVRCFDGDYGLGLGSEISQILAIYYPNRIDHMVKERFGIHGYGRYNDDFYVIHHDIEYLRTIEQAIYDEAEQLELTLNPDKTVITKLNGGHFTWLKKRIHYSDTGKIIMRLVPKNISDRRACIRKAYRECRPMASIDNSRVSWEGYALKYNGYKTVESTRTYERRIRDGQKRTGDHREKDCTGDSQ